MKKFLAACLLIALLMLTLVSCTDDFKFIDKSNDNKTEENNDSSTDKNSSNGNSEIDEKYPGYGVEIPL